MDQSESSGHHVPGTKKRSSQRGKRVRKARVRVKINSSFDQRLPAAQAVVEQGNNVQGPPPDEPQRGASMDEGKEAFTPVQRIHTVTEKLAESPKAATAIRILDFSMQAVVDQEAKDTAGPAAGFGSHGVLDRNSAKKPHHNSTIGTAKPREKCEKKDRAGETALRNAVADRSERGVRSSLADLGENQRDKKRKFGHPVKSKQDQVSEVEEKVALLMKQMVYQEEKLKRVAEYLPVIAAAACNGTWGEPAELASTVLQDLEQLKQKQVQIGSEQGQRYAANDVAGFAAKATEQWELSEQRFALLQETMEMLQSSIGSINRSSAQRGGQRTETIAEQIQMCAQSSAGQREGMSRDEEQRSEDGDSSGSGSWVTESEQDNAGDVEHGGDDFLLGQDSLEGDLSDHCNSSDNCNNVKTLSRHLDAMSIDRDNGEPRDTGSVKGLFSQLKSIAFKNREGPRDSGTVTSAEGQKQMGDFIQQAGSKYGIYGAALEDELEDAAGNFPSYAEWSRQQAAYARGEAWDGLTWEELGASCGLEDWAEGDSDRYADDWGETAQANQDIELEWARRQREAGRNDGARGGW